MFRCHIVCIRTAQCACTVREKEWTAVRENRRVSFTGTLSQWLTLTGTDCKNETKIHIIITIKLWTTLTKTICNCIIEKKRRWWRTCPAIFSSWNNKHTAIRRQVNHTQLCVSGKISLHALHLKLCNTRGHVISGEVCYHWEKPVTIYWWKTWYYISVH